jgi:hypothetical protein
VPLLGALLGVAAGFLALGVIDAQTRYPAQTLREDFALMRSALIEAHAGLYTYRSPREITRLFDSVEQRVHEMSESEFLATIAPAIAGVHDGHTLLLPSEGWFTWYQDSAAVLPIRIRLIAGHAFVTASADLSVTIGSELQAIDGHPIPAILEELRAHLPLDGNAATGIAAGWNRRFELWYYLYVERPPSFLLRFRPPGGHTITAHLPAVAPSKLPPGPTEPPLALTALDSTTALLRVATFAADDIEGAGIDYPDWLDSAFAEVSRWKTTHLIIDLRGNEGGRDAYGSLLLRHLMTEPFSYYRRLVARTDRVSFWPQTQLDPTFNQTFGAGLQRTATGEFLLPPSRHQNLGTQAPATPLFTGRVWILIDGGTFSTAAEFCAVARSLGRATFVGEETGGTYEGNASGTFAILTLRHTGIRVVVPLVRYELAVHPVRHRGRGIRPDYPPQGAPTLDDHALVSRVQALIARARSH